MIHLMTGRRLRLLAALWVLAEVLVIAGVFGVVSLASTATWTVAGVGIARLLRGSARGLRAFNVVMALLLAASVIPFIQP